MKTITLDELLLGAIGDDDPAINELLADAAMLHDWLSERDLPGVEGEWCPYDDNCVEVFNLQDAVGDNVRETAGHLIEAVAEHVNEELGLHEDHNPYVRFEWDLPNRRIFFKPQVYAYRDHAADDVGLDAADAAELNVMLLAHGISEVDISFDGSGDSGDLDIDNIEYLDSQREDSDGDDCPVRDDLISMANKAIRYDWYNNDGGHGTLTFTCTDVVPSDPEEKALADVSFEAYYLTREQEDSDEDDFLCVTY